jgi:hypothetical protein
MRTELHQTREVDEFDVWRRAQLVAAGFSSSLAGCVARDHGYDLHALIELAEAGCPPELAVRILAPLERDPA